MTDRMKAQTRILFVIASTLIISSCAVFSPIREKPAFVSVRGTHLVLGNRPYHFLGTNMWYGCYLGSPGTTGDRPRLLRELDSLCGCGLRNLRILAASEESAIRHSVRPAIQKAPGVLDDSLLQGLDFLLAEMAKRDMHAVLYLGNYWEWSGGFSQYNVWSGGPTVDPEDTTQGWAAFMEYSATFYSNPAALTMYRSYVRSIVTRRNSVNQRLYTEDPTIMSWQLVNEPRPGHEARGAVANLPAFNRWIDETAALIHSLDTNHIVNAGSEGIHGTLGSDDYYLIAYETPHIDYLNLHLWPLNWGWFEPTRWEETIAPTESLAVRYIARHLALARRLNKPIVMDEFGIGRDSGLILPSTTTRARDRYFRFVLQVLLDSARAGAPLAGANVWAWGGEGKAEHPDGMWRTGDSFVGDPPQEPQGRNSVFMSDTSTIAILHRYARLISAVTVSDTTGSAPPLR